MKKITNYFLYFAILLVPLLSLGQGLSLPFTISGFNEDVIANGTGAASTSTTSDVDGVSFAFKSLDWKLTATSSVQTKGFPVDGIIHSLSTSGLYFKLAPYNQNNSIKLSAVSSSITSNVTTTYNTSKIYILTTGGSGAATLGGTITFTDNTTQTFTGLSIPDWYATTGLSQTFINFGRINISNNNIEDGTDTSQPRLFQATVDILNANQAKIIKSITFTKTAGAGIINIFAVSAEVIEPCPTPFPVTINVLSDIAADVSWSVPATIPQNGYQYEVRTSGMPGSGSVGLVFSNITTGLNSSITGLQALTKYYLYIKSVCSPDNGIWKWGATFTTPCAVFTGNFCEGFESLPNGSSTNPSLPSCWSYFRGKGSGYGYSYISTTYAHTGSAGFYTYPYNDTELFLVSPKTDNLGNGTKQLRFWAKLSYFYPGCEIRIYRLAGPTINDTRTLIQTIALTNNTSWQEFLVPLSATTDDYFAIAVYGASSQYPSIYLDDICYENLSPCIFPMNFAVSNITATTVDLSWNPSLSSSVTGYDYEVRDMAGNVIKSGSPTGTTDKVTGLIPGTNYTVYVRSVCGTTKGDWTLYPVSFTTLCVALAGNFSENFDTTVAGTTSIPSPPNCWTYWDAMTGTGYGYTYNNAIANSAPNSFRFYMYNSTSNNNQYLYLISPETVNLGNGAKQLRFSARAGSTTVNSRIEIVRLNDKSSPATAVSSSTVLATLNLTNDVYQEFIVPFPVTTDDYFAFRVTYDGIPTNLYPSTYIDDIFYEDLSACAAPGNIGAINITATGSTINWDKSLATGVTGYDWEVRDMNGTVVRSGVVTSANTVSAPVTGLTPGTYYQVYVRSKCGTSNGAWTTIPFKFATLCAVLTGNFFEGFENTPAGTTTNASPPLCWTYLDHMTGTGYGYTYNAEAKTGVNSFRFYYNNASSNNNQYLYLISPETNNLGNGNKQIRFSAKVVTAPSKLEVVRLSNISTPAAATTSATVIATFNLTNSGYQEFIAYPPVTTDDYFAFRVTYDGVSSNFPSTYIDDIYYEDIPPLVVDVTKTDILCNGATTGTVDAAVKGGKPAYKYAWTPSGATTASVSNLAAGTHTVTVTDDRGTVTTSSVTITQPTLILPNLSFVNISCNGKNDGSARVAPSGGVAPYTVLWSDGVIGLTRTKLTPGAYSVTVRDANGCPITQNFTILEPAVITTGVSSQSNVTVYGGNDGSATVSATGGTAPFTYAWSPYGGTADTATNLGAGTYSVLITDSNGCTTTQSVVITQPAIPYDIVLVSQKNISCNGANDGSITVNVTGGTPPYSYVWSNGGGNTPVVSNLAAGTYTLTVTDGDSSVLTKSYVITEPSVLNVTGSLTNVTCNGSNNGTATASVTGGTAPYTYFWSNGMTTASANNLSAGNYSVTVTDANNCKATASVTIVQPGVLSVTPTVTNISCSGQIDGSVILTVNGGAAPFTYLWSSGQTTANINGLSAGVYSVTVTDANNCSATQTVTITSPAFVHAPVATNQSFCTGQNATLANVVVAGSNIKWYNAATAGTLLPSSTILVSGTTYYASQTVGTCESSTRTAVQITLGQGTPLTTTQLNVCNNTRVQNMTIDGFNYTQLKWYASATSTTELLSSQLLATGIYYVSSYVGTCESTRQAITVNVAATVPAPTASSQTVCSNKTLDDLVVGKDPSSTLRWYSSPQILTPLSGTTVVSTGTYYVQQVIGNCESVRIPVAVQVISVSAPAMTAIATCQGNTVADLHPSVGKYVWYTNNSTTTPLAETFVITAGTYYIAFENSGCASARTQVVVTVSPRPTSPTGQPNQLFGFAARVSNLVMNQPNVIWFASYNDAVRQQNQLSPNHLLEHNTTYYGILTGTNNCGSLPIAVTVTLNLSNAELDLAQLKYYPNPVDSELNITYIEEVTKVEVFTITGQKVLSSNYQSNEVRVDLSRLSSGTYLVRIDTEKASQFVKVIKK